MVRSFVDRIAPRRAWSAVALYAPRWLVAVALAVVPALALLAYAYVAPEVTSADRVRDTFARFISGLITAATIAVGFATLALRRGIKGLGELREHMQADRAFAERVGQATGHETPAAVGETFALLLDAAAERANALREPELAAHLDEVAGGVRRSAGDPNGLLFSALDLDGERGILVARTRVRDERLTELIEMALLARSYTKTLATQWGLGRMAQAIAITSMGAVVVAAAMVLAYEQGPWAPIVLGGALFGVLVPLATFVSYTMRFTFVNQHTLPIGHFVLGPEDPKLARTRGRPQVR